MEKSIITILDGGMGRELEQSGAPFRQPEWSALALMEAPQLVKKAHESFINAGAQIITTNAYALVPYHIGQERFNNKGANLIELSAQLARDAADESGKDVKVAGCIPPLFGSYRPQHFDEGLVHTILPQLINNQEALIDFWLVETLSSAQEALNILRGIKELSNKKIWAAFTLSDSGDNDMESKLRSQEPLLEVLRTLHENNLMPDTLLFNCSQPEFMSAAIDKASAFLGDMDVSIPIGAYANSFVKKQHKPANETITDLREEITAERYLEFAKNWVEHGASIIGGCCGIGPDYIRTLSQNLND